MVIVMLRSGYLARVLCILSACIISTTTGTNVGTNLLRQNHDGPTNEGTLFAVAFMRNAPSPAPQTRAILYVMNRNPTIAFVEVSIPRDTSNTFSTYPQTVSIAPNAKHEFVFPTTTPDIRVDGPRDTTKGIRVRVTNNIPVTVVGSNSEDKSTDAFLVLPCQTVDINSYKYFLFSSDREGSGMSQFVVVNCEADTTATYSGATSGNPMALEFQTYSVISNADFTGESITSDKPVAVFSGHECGNIPADISACDHLVEQIPMHAVYGNTFFTSPFGYRGAGEMYRVGSLLDNNVITTTCTKRSGSSSPVTTTTTRTINSGGFHEFYTDNADIGAALTNYRREFCCIETSQPAIVMQYMPSHSRDETSVTNIGNGIGDPAISIIPPVEQYRNSFISTTITLGSIDTFTNLVTYTVPAEFLTPPVSNEIFLNGMELNPAPLQGGTGDYIPIRCSNGEVCGYGAISPLSVASDRPFRLEFNSSKDPYAGASFNLYGYVSEMSYAYPAGFEMEPIGLPRIAVYSVTVPESIGSVSIVFNRTGGDLSTGSRILVQNRDVPGQAVEGVDYTLTTTRNVGNSVRIRFRRNEIDPRAGDEFVLAITNDEIDEADEYFEVFFTIEANGYPFPGVARVTIIDDDGTSTPNVQFDPTTYRVTEGQSTPVTLRLSSASSSPVTAIISSSDGRAVANSDYTPLNSQSVTFPANQLTTTFNVATLNDDINELTENFGLTITSASGATVGTNNEATVTIDDNDPLSVQFNPVMYTALEGEAVNFMAQLNRPADRQVTVAFNTADGTATVAGNDYTAISTVLTFPSGTTLQSQSVATTADTIADSGEMFTAVLSSPTNGLTLGSASTATATIQDAIVVGFDPDTYTVNEGDGQASLMVVLSRPSSRVLTVDFETKTGTATATDFTSTTTTVTFPVGSTSQTVMVPILNDNINELTESFTAELASAPDYQLGISVATVTINDNDALEFSINPPTVTIDEGGTGDLTVELNVAADREVGVTVTSGGGSATPTDDYEPISVQLTFQPGETDQIIEFETNEDTLDEPNETFQVTLSNPTSGTVGSSDSSTITIRDNDDPLSVQFEPVEYTTSEGTSAGLMVVLSRDPVSSVEVTVATVPGSATAANDDYTSVTRTVTFPAGGSRTMTVAVPVLLDSINDPGESFTAELRNPTGAELGSDSTATINIVDTNPVNVQFNPVAYTINEGSSGQIMAVLNVPSTRDLSVEFDTMDGTATSDSGDYTVVRRTLTFPAGTTSQSVPVSVSDDNVGEPSEMFTAVLSNPGSGLTVGTQDTATITIPENDTPSVRFEPASYTGTEGDTENLMIVLSNPSSSEVTVLVTSTDGTATGGDDYPTINQRVTFSPGTTSVSVPVNLLEDSVHEQPEDFTATISSPTGATLGSPTTATVTIMEDDNLLVNFDPVSYMPTEGDTVMLTATLNSPASREVTVQVRTVEGTATDPEDYTGGVVTLTFPAGQTTATASIPTDDDSIQEGVERFTAELFNPQGGLTVGPADTATVDITDNDVVMVMFNPTDYTVNEGGNTLITAVLSTPSTEPVTVNVRSTSGTATDGTDYTSVNQVLTFQPGDTSTTFQVNALTDMIDEQRETFSLTLSNPTNGVLGAATTATVNIDDTNDVNVQFNPVAYTISEGSSGQIMAVLNVPSTRELTVEFNTVDGTATSDSGDYSVVRRTLTFPAGSTSQSVPVSVSDDNVGEPSEMFTAVLSNPGSGLTVGTQDTATITIPENDTPAVRFEPSTYTGTEGDTENLMIVLTNPSSTEVTVLVTTTDGTATGGDDYSSINRRVTFSPGTTSVSVPVNLMEDNVHEQPEDFTATISSPTGATLGTPTTATVTIMEDDMLLVNFNPSTYSVNEGSSVTLMAMLNSPADREVTVVVTTEPDTAGESDYTSVTMTLTFPIGQTTASVPVTTTQDDIQEGTEQFRAVLSNPTNNLRIGSEGTATVSINDDDVVNVQFDPTTYTVNEDEGPESVTVILTKPSAERVLVDVETRSGTAETPSDYTTVTQTLTFEPNEVEQTVSIGITDDNTNEDDESFTVMLSNPRGAQLGSDDTATVTVQDDDPLEIRFNPDQYIGSEGDSVNLMVALNRPADRQITVDLTTGDNTATSPSDYIATTVTVTFPVGETMATVPVRLVDDGVNEDLEDFRATLSNPSGGATVTGGTATVSVQDRNLINFNPVTYTIDEGTTGMLTLELTNPPTSEVTVDVTLNPGTATTSDYDGVPRTVTVTFPAGQTTQTVPVTITEDTISEGPEMFTATISNPMGGGFAIGPDDTATITITDDDSLTVNFNPTTYTVTEGENEDIMVVLSNPSTSPVTVEVVTVEGSADDDDFTEFVRTVTFAPSVTTLTVPVMTTEDETDEANEIFSVVLRNPSGADLGSSSRAEVTIVDDDVVVVEFDPTSYTVTEGGDAVLTVVTDRPSDRDVIVTVRPLDGSAMSPSDFTSGDRSVTFPSGQRSRQVTIPTIDDNTAETTEMFNAILVNPSSNADVGDRGAASVEINDNDDIVINFEETSYEVIENEDTVEVCISINRPADRKLCINGTIMAGEALEISDYLGRRVMFNISAGNTRACEEIDIVDDSTVESREIFRVVLESPDTPINARLGDDTTTEVTIIDDDSFSVDIEERNYRVRENETSLEVCALLSNPSSDSITVTANTLPGTAEAGEDYVSSTLTFMFGPNEQRACSRVTIVDNDVMEPTENFRIMINPPTDPDGPAPGPRSTSNVTIDDDDSVTIRLVDENPVVSENSSNVVICVQKVGRSDEDITLNVRAVESSPPDARDGEDFETTTTTLTISSSDSMACITVPIIDDETGMEPDRSFVLIVDPPPGVTPSLRGRVTVQDNDVVCVSWERSGTDGRTVTESDQTLMECFTTDRASFTGFPVRITTQGTTANPATFGADYRTTSQDFNVQVPSGPGGRYCVDVTIIDDTVADEGLETFALSFGALPQGARLCSDRDVSISITDPDTVVVLFKTPDEEVPESTGNAMVCLIRNATTEEAMTVNVQTTFGSAGDDDLESVSTSVVFQPNDMESCFEVPIKDDSDPEPREAFSLSIIPQTPGQPRISTSVIIIDDDTPRTPACVIRDTLRVSAFNSGPSYQFRGTCELTALQSCNGSRPDFAVRVDYLSDTLDLGAIGIVKDGFAWSIREDQSVQTTSTETPTVSGSSSTYQQSAVTVTRNTGNTTLAVGDGIGITITRSFAAENSVTIEVSSGSSLLETCGICGTQQGQLLGLDGRVTAMDASMEEKQVFVASYRVPARDQVLRPVRPECAIIRNDTVIGDPLYTVPVGTDNMNLCYEIHGAPNRTYNLISDDCVSVNAYYSPVGDLNIISSIGIRAEGNSQTCRDIRVDLNNCAAFASPMGGGDLVSVPSFLEEDGISVRRYSDRVRIVVPRCNKLRLVMWVICEPENTRYNIPASIRFHVSRGVNLNPTAHGLLGQFWNIPISVTRISGDNYNVTVQQVGKPPRYILGERFERTWDNTKEPCIYMGDAQGGRSGEDARLDDTVIEGNYKNYELTNLFETAYEFSQWESDCTAN